MSAEKTAGANGHRHCLMCPEIPNQPYAYVTEDRIPLCTRPCSERWDGLSFAKKNEHLQKIRGELKARAA